MGCSIQKNFYFSFSSQLLGEILSSQNCGTTAENKLCASIVARANNRNDPNSVAEQRLQQGRLPLWHCRVRADASYDRGAPHFADTASNRAVIPVSCTSQKLPANVTFSSFSVAVYGRNRRQVLTCSLCGQLTDATQGMGRWELNYNES